jgi:cholinesterase
LIRESAGGASTDFYSYAWHEDPIINGAIAESGTVASFANPQPPNNLQWWTEAAKKLKCPSEPITESVKCIRTKNTEELLEATKVENPLLAVLGHFGPNVDNKLVFGDYAERAKAGKFIQKPYMAGNNHYEAGLFVLIAQGGNIKVPANVWPTFNAAVFTCPVADAAAARVKKGLLAFRYRFFGDWANTNLMPGSGAYHTAEIPMIFGTSEEATSSPNEPKQTQISNFMQKVWTQFAKDPEALTKAPFNLPRYNAETAFTENTLIGFGANNRTTQMLIPSGYDMFCETIVTMLKDVPGGVTATITNVATGKDMGIPGLKTEELPDMSPPELPPAPA